MSKKKRDPSREASRETSSETALRKELESRPRRAPAQVVTAAAGDATAPTMLARTYLPESLLVTLLCLTPVAFPAIYYGFQVRQASEAGDQQKASAASEMAHIWFILSVGFGATANIAMLGFYLVSQKA